MRTVLLSCVLSAMAAAQVPTDTVLVLESTTAFLLPNYRLVDVLGRGVTTVRGQNVFMLPSPVSVATDPISTGRFFFHANPSSLAGTWRSEVSALARIGQSMWGPWSQVAGERVEVGDTQIFLLRNGIVDVVAKAGGQPTQLLQLANATDIAVVDPFLYVASHGASSPAPVIEWNLSTGTQRTVGNYLGVRSLAASRLTAELCLGLDSGDLQRVDVATGAVTSTIPTGLGAIRSVGFTRFGTVVYSNGVELWSEVVANGPIYTSPTSIVDFGVAIALGASVTPFGEGCGVAAAATWAAASLPTLGNAAFMLGLRNGPGNALAVLSLGDSRTLSPVLGVALPFDMQAIGAVGCDLLVDPQVLLLHVTSAIGEADQIVPIPNSVSLVGSEYCGQWFVSDPMVGSLGLAGTEGVTFVVR